MTDNVFNCPGGHGHLQRLCDHVSMLRVPGAFKSRWTFSVTVLYRTPTDVMLFGAERAPEPSEWRHMRRTLKASGVTVARFYRVNDAGEIDLHAILL